jgi:hypothetical protein
VFAIVEADGVNCHKRAELQHKQLADCAPIEAVVQVSHCNLERARAVTVDFKILIAEDELRIFAGSVIDCLRPEIKNRRLIRTLGDPEHEQEEQRAPTLTDRHGTFNLTGCLKADFPQTKQPVLHLVMLNVRTIFPAGRSDVVTELIVEHNRRIFQSHSTFDSGSCGRPESTEPTHDIVPFRKNKRGC